MTLAERIAKLRPEVAFRVRERACLIYFGCPGTSWPEADRRAYLEEHTDQRSLPLAEGFAAKVDELAEVLP